MKFVTFVKRRLSIIREVLEVLGNRRLRRTSYTIIRIVGTIRSVSAMRTADIPPHLLPPNFQHPDIEYG